jgi:hypothetical protein
MRAFLMPVPMAQRTSEPFKIRLSVRLSMMPVFDVPGKRFYASGNLNDMASAASPRGTRMPEAPAMVGFSLRGGDVAPDFTNATSRCHSERSEEFLCRFACTAIEERFFASLRMTR